MRNYLRQIALLGFFTCIVPVVSFSAHDDAFDEPTQELSSTWASLQEYLSSFDSDKLSLSPQSEISLGILLLVTGYFADPATTGLTGVKDILVPIAMFFLTHGMGKGCADYYDNFGQKNVSQKQKKKQPSKQIDYRNARIRSINCLKATMNIISNGYAFYLVVDSALLMIQRGQNPLLDPNLEECTGHFCFAPGSPTLLVLSLSSLAYNIRELINNIRNKEVYEYNIPLFDALNGVALGTVLGPVPLSQSFCEEMFQFRSELIDRALANSEQAPLIFEMINECESRFIGYVPYMMGQGYGNGLVAFGVGKTVWNIAKGGYKYWRGPVKQFNNAKNELLLEREPKRPAPRVSHVLNSSQQIKNEVAIFVPEAGRNRVSNSDELDNPALAQGMIAIGGNYEQPKKSKNRQTTAKATKQAKVKLTSQDLKKIQLIKEAFSISEDREVSKNRMENLANRAAKLLGGQGGINGNRFSISWNNGNKKDTIVSFERAHNPPSFSGYKKTKAIKSIIKALIYDEEEEKIALYQNQIQEENTAWRLALHYLFKRTI